MSQTNGSQKKDASINHFFRRNDSITLNQIKSFIAVYELGSLSKAAELICKTQPAISHNLQKLEEKLNTQFVRRDRGKRIDFTEEGHRFYKDIYPLVDQLLIKIDEVESKNTITVGLPDDIDVDIQIELYQKISAVTDSRIRFICGFSGEIYNMVNSGRISFGIFKQESTSGTLDYCWAGSPDTLPFDAYEKLPLVAGYSGCIIRDLVEKTLRHAGKDFYFVYLSNRIFNRVQAVQNNFGVGVFSKKRIIENPSLVVLGEDSGFPALESFSYQVVGEEDSARKKNILPILKACVADLNLKGFGALK